MPIAQQSCLSFGGFNYKNVHGCEPFSLNNEIHTKFDTSPENRCITMHFYEKVHGCAWFPIYPCKALKT